MIRTLSDDDEPRACHDEHPPGLYFIFVLEDWQDKTSGDVCTGDRRHAVRSLLFVHRRYMLQK